MKEIIGWFVAVLVVGILFYVIERLAPIEGTFRFIFRLMAGIIAFVFFVLFLLAVLKYMHIPTPW